MLTAQPLLPADPVAAAAAAVSSTSVTEDGRSRRINGPVSSSPSSPASSSSSSTLLLPENHHPHQHHHHTNHLQHHIYSNKNKSLSLLTSPDLTGASVTEEKKEGSILSERMHLEQMMMTSSNNSSDDDNKNPHDEHEQQQQNEHDQLDTPVNAHTITPESKAAASNSSSGSSSSNMKRQQHNTETGTSNGCISVTDASALAAAAEITTAPSVTGSNNCALPVPPLPRGGRGENNNNNNGERSSPTGSSSNSKKGVVGDTSVNVTLDMSSEVSDLGEFSPDTTDNNKSQQQQPRQQQQQQQKYRVSSSSVRRTSSRHDDDDDSSNDDSSYFADPSNLPSPKSGHRRFSHSSLQSGAGGGNNNNGISAQHHQLPLGNNGINSSISMGYPLISTSSTPLRVGCDAISRESDASLSLSDDSDDDADLDDTNDSSGHFMVYHHQQQIQQHHHHKQQHNTPHLSINTNINNSQKATSVIAAPNLVTGVPEMYPRPITRMHSVSSLVSTSSQCSTNTNTEDDDPDNELRQVAVVHRNHSSSSNGKIPSGRLSPILGQHPPSRGGRASSAKDPIQNSSSSIPQSLFHSPVPDPSPPTIMSSYGQQLLVNHQMKNNNGAMITHPQPHQMTPEEMAKWISSASSGLTQEQQQQAYAIGAFLPASMYSPLHNHNNFESPLSREGSKESRLWCYSEDTNATTPTPTSSASTGAGTAPNAAAGPPSDQSKKEASEPSAPGNGQPRGGGSRNNGGGMHYPGPGGGYSGGYHPSGGGGYPGGGGGFYPNSGPHPFQPKDHQNSGNSGTEGEDSPDSGVDNNDDDDDHHDEGFKVYWQRWIMLMYMSILNLLSDWTCYSVAPIAVMTEEAFGNIDPERLVVVFLMANGVATACEPMILSRLGLRRTVLFGALLLMIGSIVKSGGMPPIIKPDLQKGHGEWRVYAGFFLVGLSQPLYQCTPALLSASWFPERERTMATGVALNANQVGIGFAFIFGTLLVENSDDIPDYFSLLSIISTITFLGVLCQFDDAPPTPPSDTARVMRGTLDMRLPSIRSIFASVRNLGGSRPASEAGEAADVKKLEAEEALNLSAAPSASSAESSGKEGKPKSSARSSNKEKDTSSTSSSKRSRSSRKNLKASTLSRQRSGGSKTRSSPRAQGKQLEGEGFHGLTNAPSPANWSDVCNPHSEKRSESLLPSPANWEQPTNDDHYGSTDYYDPIPQPMMPSQAAAERGQQQAQRDSDVSENDNPSATEDEGQYPSIHQGHMNPYGHMAPNHPYGFPYPPFPQQYQQQVQGHDNPYAAQGMPNYPGAFYGTGGPGYDMPQMYPQPGYGPQAYWDPRFQQYIYYPPPPGPPGRQPYQAVPNPYGGISYGYQYPSPHMRHYEMPDSILPPAEELDAGAEPVLTITPHNLDIDIRDDQIILSTKACLRRKGFIHALVAFTVSGIVINTLSTFMDYLVRLNGVGREYTGIVGGSFQFVIMISSLLVGQVCDKTRAYYSVTVGMLVLGAFGLAQCGVNLDSDKGVELRWSLVIVAALVGPLQPVSTELGVDVVYPLSENTVLVIQQLFSNLLSALFIPCFKAFKDVGLTGDSNVDHPEYTFSFYILIVLHAAATVFFATFNGRYLRYEHELIKKEEEERRQKARRRRRSQSSSREQQPLLGPYV